MSAWLGVCCSGFQMKGACFGRHFAHRPLLVATLAAFIHSSLPLTGQSSSLNDFLQRLQQALDFVRCVVVGQADSQETPVFFHIETLGQA